MYCCLGRDDKRVESRFLMVMVMKTLFPEEIELQPRKCMRMMTTMMRLDSDKVPSKPWRRRDPKPDWFCPISVDRVK